MRTTVKLFLATSLIASTSFAGPGKPGPGGETARPEAARLSNAARTSMRNAFESSGIAKSRDEATELVKKWESAGLPEMKPDVLRKLSGLRAEAKTAVNDIISKMTNTVINAKQVSNLGENGKLILEAASKLATSVVETIANDSTGSVDITKINEVVTLIESVSSRNDLANEGTLLVKIQEINAKLGNGRTIRDLKDCF